MKTNFELKGAKMSTNFSRMMLLAVLWLSPMVLADGASEMEMTPPKDKTTPTQKTTGADRKAKSEMFGKMAQCLKSDKSEAQCEKELQGNCHQMGGMNRCGMGMMMGKMGQSMMGKKMKGMGMDKMGGGMNKDAPQGDENSDKTMEPME